MTKKKLLIFIPCFNDHKTLPDVINGIPNELFIKYKTKLLVVDDGSKNKIDKILKSLDKKIHIVRHKENYGLGEAFRTAQKYFIDINFDVMVTLDADNQFDQKDIYKLINPIFNDEADVVIASRFINKKLKPIDMPFIKKIGNFFFSSLVSILLKQKITDLTCGFRAYSKNAMWVLNTFSDFTYTHETLIDLISKKFKIVQIGSKVKYFKNRDSKISGNLAAYGLKSLIIILKLFRDYYPMKFFGYLGLINFILAFFFSFIFFYNYLKNGYFDGFLFAGFLSGFFFTLSVILFFMAFAFDMLLRIRINQEKIILNTRYIVSKRDNEK